jgi:peptidoglycan/LPS O-acetylase OafA/YrhL
VEMMFYMVFPFVFTKIKNINGAMIFLNLCLLFKFLTHEIILYFDFLPKGLAGREFLFYYLPAQLPIFALGFVLYFIIDNYSNLKTISFSTIFLLFLLLPIQIGSTIDFLYLNHIIFGIGFVGIAVFMSSEKGRFVSIFPLRYIGKISYSLYITHFIVISWLSHFKYIDFCENYLINYLVRFLVILLISVFVSTLTHHLIEIPFQNWAKKIIAKRSLNLLK